MKQHSNVTCKLSLIKITGVLNNRRKRIGAVIQEHKPNLHFWRWLAHWRITS